MAGTPGTNLASGCCYELCDLGQVTLLVGVSPFVRFCEAFVSQCMQTIPGTHNIEEFYFYLYCKKQGM